MSEIRDRLMQAARYAGVSDSQAKIAASLGLERATVNRWVLGAREPSAEMLVHIASSWGVSVQWLQTGKGDMLTEPSAGYSAEELELVRDYRKASPDKRDLIRQMVRVARKSIVTIATTIPPLLAAHGSSGIEHNYNLLTAFAIRNTHCMRRLLLGLFPRRLVPLT